jgi:predicted transposase/invertase (TIGR01784 family)
MKFIDPRIDFAFKKIFGSEDGKDILINFLESLMGLEGDRRIKTITLLDPFQAPKIRGMKYSVLDVKCLDNRGIHYVVEMQIEKVRAFVKRIQYNAAKAYVNQIASAEDYPKLDQVIAITITDFVLFDMLEQPVSRHIMREDATGKSLLDAIVHYLIELPKFQKGLEELSCPLDQWIYFIRMAGKLEEEPPGWHAPPIHHAFEKARIANLSREEFEDYEKAGMAVADRKGAIELANEKGIREGLHKGHLKGLQEGLQEGHRKGLQEGSTKILLLLLETRFGPLPHWVPETLNDADEPTLNQWTLRVIKANTLEDVFLEA